MARRRREETFEELSGPMRAALLHLGGQPLAIRRSPNWTMGETAGRTARALEDRGLAQRMHTGFDAGLLTITAKGEAMLRSLDDDPDELLERLEEEGEL